MPLTLTLEAKKKRCGMHLTMQFITNAQSVGRILMPLALPQRLKQHATCSCPCNLSLMHNPVGRILMPLALTPETQTACNCPFINHSSVHIQNTKLKNLKTFTIPTAIILSQYIKFTASRQNKSNLHLLLQENLPSCPQFPNDNANHPCGHTFLLEIHSKEQKKNKTKQNKTKLVTNTFVFIMSL